MKLFQTLLTVSALALATQAVMAHEVPDLSQDPGSSTPPVATATGMWLESGQLNDARQVLMGHIKDAQGNKAVALLAVLVPKPGTFGVESLQKGKIYGELRAADMGALSSDLSEIFNVDPDSADEIGLVGNWWRRSDGIGQFNALVTAGDDVIIGVMRGTFGADLNGGSSSDPLSTANPLSHANPFGLATQGQPTELIALPDPFEVALKLSAAKQILPEVSVERGEFVAQWSSYK